MWHSLRMPLQKAPQLEFFHIRFCVIFRITLQNDGGVIRSYGKQGIHYFR
jgi:hypothetical protein